MQNGAAGARQQLLYQADNENEKAFESHWHQESLALSLHLIGIIVQVAIYRTRQYRPKNDNELDSIKKIFGSTSENFQITDSDTIDITINNKYCTQTHIKQNPTLADRNPASQSKRWNEMTYEPGRYHELHPLKMNQHFKFAVITEH